MLNSLRHLKLALATLICVVGLFSCQRINHSNEAEDFEDAKEFLYFQHASWIAVQFAEHINATGSTLGLNVKMMDSLSKQLKSTYLIIDSSYLDNNGIEYELAFNKQNSGNYSPYENFTPYQFEGKLNITVDQNYREINSKSEINISESNPLIVEYPNFGRVKVYGTIELERISVSSIRVKYKDFKIVSEDDSYHWDADLEYSWLKGLDTDGLWNDQIQFKGNGKLVELGEKEDQSEFQILSPLTKSFEPGCSDYFQMGSLLLSTKEDKFNIDFDPFKNGSCSSLVRITNEKGELEFTGP